MRLIAVFEVNDGRGRTERMEFEWTDESGIPTTEYILEAAEEEFGEGCSCLTESCNHCECDPLWDEGTVRLIEVITCK